MIGKTGPLTVWSAIGGVVDCVCIAVSVIACIAYLGASFEWWAPPPMPPYYGLAWLNTCAARVFWNYLKQSWRIA